MSVDIEKLKATGRAADPHGAAHLVTHYRNSADVKAEEAWRIAANPAAVLELIAEVERLTCELQNQREITQHWKAAAGYISSAPAAGTVEKDAERLADGYQGSTMVSDFHGPKITMRYATSAQADAAHAVLCDMVDAAIEAHNRAGKEQG